MRLLDFQREFPDEEACIERFREQREKDGMKCPKCGGAHYHYIKGTKQYHCDGCGKRWSLRSGTVLENSKMPFLYWFVAMHLLTSTKHSFSAAEIQRQLGHKRYQPIWEICHKLRSVMGRRDSEYALRGGVEIDEGFFSIERDEEDKGETQKRGAGSQKKAKVLVMAESEVADNPKNPEKPKKVGHIKMSVIPDLKKKTINEACVNSVDRDSVITTDGSSSHNDFKDLFAEHEGAVVPPSMIGRVLPWVHIAIANAKTTLADLYHGVRREYLQGYLSEFCYKFNRRYFGDRLFDRLLMVCASYTPDFEHRTYRKTA